MNILFLTITKIESFADRGIYTDLLSKFAQEGHQIFTVSPIERREAKETYLVKEKSGEILNIKTLNLQKTNLIEKGIGTFLVEYQFLKGIKKYFSAIKFDLILYSTPPITFSKVINYIKKRDNAYAYLLLKDIFPQNAIDMKMLNENGYLHQLFLKKERKLYESSDTIGCMSEANKSYLLKHNPYINPENVEVNPNTIQPLDVALPLQEKLAIKKKYNLPLDKKIFVYGGNLGKPQGLDFLMETIKITKNNDIYFLIVGSGTEYNRIKKWFEETKPKHAKLLTALGKTDYDLLLSACDVGMIFLHKDFTIPNFPSRLLSYLEMKMPVIAATDNNTDIGEVIQTAKCGYAVLSGDNTAMQEALNKMVEDHDGYVSMKENAWKLLQEKYTVDTSYELIMNRLSEPFKRT